MSQFVLRDPTGQKELVVSCCSLPLALVVRVSDVVMQDELRARFDAITNFDRLTAALVEAREKFFAPLQGCARLVTHASSRFAFAERYAVVCSAKYISPIHASGCGTNPKTHMVAVEIFDVRAGTRVAKLSLSGLLPPNERTCSGRFKLDDHASLLRTMVA